MSNLKQFGGDVYYLKHPMRSEFENWKEVQTLASYTIHMENGKQAVLSQ